MSINLTNRKQYIGVIFLFFLLFLITIAIAPLIGSVQVDLGKALSKDLAFNDNVDANILFLARIPRIILAALTGASLSVAGVVFQSLLRNDLAAPFTLGVSSGAALGAVIAMSIGLPHSLTGIPAIPTAAFLGALGSITLVFYLARTRTGELPTTVLLLAGVTANFFFAALVMLIHYLSDFTQSFRIVRWLMGGLDITSYKTLISISPMIFIGFGVLMVFSRDLNVISTGIQSAMSRGVEVVKVQKIGFIMASLLTGAVVSLSGPIGFVGLIVPHIVRLIVGPDLRILLPASMFFGASFLIMCDTLARTIIAPTEIPVGIITAMLGGPFFVWLLKRPKR
ncbi:MAG: iron ABC transporter permease [Nitrospinaceae bacterium]|jgi:iron complex transport system permease protein|nr:iron ABC transporter [Nitrospinota bacterium]MDP6335607.1 iron ABC transporter permease [Nitrospinaceae bacterium]